MVGGGSGQQKYEGNLIPNSKDDSILTNTDCKVVLLRVTPLFGSECVHYKVPI
jgi:hypothetical protein